MERKLMILCFSASILLSAVLYPVASAAEKTKRSSARSKPSQASFIDESWRNFELGTPAQKEKVISSVKSYIRKNSNDGNAFYYLGIMCFETGQYGDAEENLRTALSFFPDSTDIMLKLVDITMIAGEADEETDNFLKKILTLEPENPKALSYMGQKALAEGNKNKALEMLSKSAQLDPENPATLRELARIQIDLGNPVEALSNLKKAEMLDSRDVETLWLLGKACDLLGKPLEASEAYSKAKKLGRKDVNVAGLVGYDLARAFSQAGRVEEAASEYKKAINTSSDKKTGYLELAELYENASEMNKALSTYSKCWNLFQDSKAAFKAGKIYRERDDLNNALDFFGRISRRSDEWGEQAKNESAEIKNEIEQKNRDQLLSASESDSEDTRANALHALLSKDRKDKTALEGLKELYIEKGDLGAAIYYTKELSKAGHLSKWEMESQISDLTSRMSQGESLQKYESRLDEFRNHGEYDKALAELKKIKASAESNLNFWDSYPAKNPGEKEYKAKMKKFIKAQIKELNARGKEIREEKKWHRK
ncbi:MAG: tetratricopeptide repeat protein [Candidatus Riflebacteria bacterium]|nr:tetratricopeptide repeat protein [Candidatus Riflebacteria bacterium]